MHPVSFETPRASEPSEREGDAPRDQQNSCVRSAFSTLSLRSPLSLTLAANMTYGGENVRCANWLYGARLAEPSLLSVEIQPICARARWVRRQLGALRELVQVRERTGRGTTQLRGDSRGQRAFEREPARGARADARLERVLLEAMRGLAGLVEHAVLVETRRGWTTMRTTTGEGRGAVGRAATSERARAAVWSSGPIGRKAGLGRIANPRGCGLPSARNCVVGPRAFASATVNG